MKIADAYDAMHSRYDSWTDKTRVRPSMTVLRARAILAAAANNVSPDKPAKINPVLTQKKAHEVLSGGIPTGKADDFIIEPLTARNIAREFARYLK